MTGVEEVDNRSRNVALKCLRAGRQEERIVLTPHREKRRFMCAEVVLKSRIERDVALVISEQINWISSAPGRAR